MVRLKANMTRNITFKSTQFQFQMVRLKGNLGEHYKRNAALFQFQMVRLKVENPSKSTGKFASFQFQMVRLKAVDIDDFVPLIFNLVTVDFSGTKVLKNRRCAIVYFSWSFDNSISF